MSCIGFRDVNSVLCEASLHLVEPIVNTTVFAPITGGIQTVVVGSTLACYVGALVVVAPGQVDEEIITLTGVNVLAGTITAVFANAHVVGTALLGATFPTQQPLDPFFTQQEMLDYLARAQNEFLARVPSILKLSQQTVTINQLIQVTPSDTIEINRVAVTNPVPQLVSLTRALQQVILVSPVAHEKVVGDNFTIYGATPSSFNGSFTVVTTPSPTTLTYRQVQPDDVASVPGFLASWKRLYETSQEQLSMRDTNWRNIASNTLNSWYEDRTGNYKWGVAPRPGSNFPVELLTSVRGPDSLLLTDCFLLPDLVLHYVKYLVLAWAYGKDGEQRNPKLAAFYQQRFAAGVLATQRWVDNVLESAQ